MLITREVDYALRILRAMSGGEHVTVREICEREILPQQFAYKILKKLERGGLVKVTRGAFGGCELSGNLKGVTLYDLLTMLDANGAIGNCMRPDYKCEWRGKHDGPCGMHAGLERIQNSLDAELRACALCELILG
jgi:Rrf2 family protein